MKRRDNKGMAMVTVLIAVTFIGILATSLMYMSYMNYRAKSLRYSTTDNFYTSEYGLADLSTAIRNRAANSASVATALSRFSTDVIFTDGDGNHTIISSSHSGCYDCKALAALIQNASQESDIEVGTIYDTNGDGWPDTKSMNCTVGSNFITFEGVQIISKTPEGFVTTISTDIKISFKGQKGPLDVNDFSVITDSPIILDNKNVIWGGNIYIGHGTGTNALEMSNISTCSILSDRGVINGDIVVKRGCVLTITGDITVYGKITIENGGSFICTGDLKHTKPFVAKPGSIITGIPRTHAADPSIPEISLDGDGDGTPDGLLATALMGFTYVQCQNYGCGNGWVKMTAKDIQDGNLVDFNNGLKKHNNDLNMDISVRFGLPETCNGAENSLILNAKNNMTWNNSNTDRLHLRGNLVNTTIVSIAPIVYYGDHEVIYMQSMGDDEYTYAKNMMLDGGNQIKWGGPCQWHNVSFSGGVLNDTVTFPITGGNIATKEVTAPDPGNNIMGRTAYFDKDSKKNYVPAGYFMAENASDLIAQAFPGGGSPSPKDSTITFTNFMKE